MTAIQPTPKNNVELIDSKEKYMKIVRLLVCLSVALTLVGCGQSNEAIIPTNELTPEQIAAVKAEDSAVEDEESQGKMQGGKAAK